MDLLHAVSNHDEGPRDDLNAAMPPLEAKKALFAYVPGARDRCRAAATILGHPKSHVRVVVHGDDFTFAVTESELGNDQRCASCMTSRCVVSSAAENATCARLRYWEES